MWTLTPPGRQWTQSFISCTGKRFCVWMRGGTFSACQAPRLVPEKQMHSVLSSAGGLLLRRHDPGGLVTPETILGEIVDPCTGDSREVLQADCSGRIFFAHRSQLVNGHEVAFQILPGG